MNRDRWWFLSRLWGSAVVAVATLPLLFAPAVFRPAVAAGAGLGVVAVAGVVVFDSADRLRARWDAWRETSGRTGVLLNGVLAGCSFAVWMALAMPLIESVPVASSGYAGVRAALNVLFFTAFHALGTWVSEKYGDRLTVNEAPDPP
jgi:hypothetical protein